MFIFLGMRRYLFHACGLLFSLYLKEPFTRCCPIKLISPLLYYGNSLCLWSKSSILLSTNLRLKNPKANNFSKLESADLKYLTNIRSPGVTRIIRSGLFKNGATDFWDWNLPVRKITYVIFWARILTTTFPKVLPSIVPDLIKISLEV